MTKNIFLLHRNNILPLWGKGSMMESLQLTDILPLWGKEI